jgi:hypothetical protein
MGEWRYSSMHSLTLEIDGGDWSASRPDRFTPRERAPGTHWIGGWVGPRAVLDAVMKRKIPSSRWESNPGTPIFQPVAQRYPGSLNRVCSLKLKVKAARCWIPLHETALACTYREGHPIVYSVISRLSINNITGSAAVVTQKENTVCRTN